MRLTLHTFLTLDGVMQAPGGPEEDPSAGFSYGGWSVPYGDQDFGVAMAGWFEHASAFLLGRKTYQIFAGHWPKVTDPADPIASKLNALPKYVASATLGSLDWNNAQLLGGDVVSEVVKLKERPGPAAACRAVRTVLNQLVTALTRLGSYKFMKLWEWCHPGGRALSDCVALVAARQIAVASLADRDGHDLDRSTGLDRHVGRLTEWAASQALTVGEVVREVGSGLNGWRLELRRVLPGPSATAIDAERRYRSACFGVEHLGAAS